MGKSSSGPQASIAANDVLNAVTTDFYDGTKATLPTSSNDPAMCAAKRRTLTLAFETFYMWNGSRRRYMPGFIVNDHHDNTLVFEIKGRPPRNDAKYAVLEECITAVNGDKRFGERSWAVAYKPMEVDDNVAKL